MIPSSSKLLQDRYPRPAGPAQALSGLEAVVFLPTV